MSVPPSERLQRFSDLSPDQFLIATGIVDINDSRDGFRNNSNLDIAQAVFPREFAVNFMDKTEESQTRSYLVGRVKTTRVAIAKRVEEYWENPSLVPGGSRTDQLLSWARLQPEYVGKSAFTMAGVIKGEIVFEQLRESLSEAKDDNGPLTLGVDEGYSLVSRLLDSRMRVFLLTHGAVFSDGILEKMIEISKGLFVQREENNGQSISMAQLDRNIREILSQIPGHEEEFFAQNSQEMQEVIQAMSPLLSRQDFTAILNTLFPDSGGSRSPMAPQNSPRFGLNGGLSTKPKTIFRVPTTVSRRGGVRGH